MRVSIHRAPGAPWDLSTRARTRWVVRKTYRDETSVGAYSTSLIWALRVVFGSNIVTPRREYDRGWWRGYITGCLVMAVVPPLVRLLPI